MNKRTTIIFLLLSLVIPAFAQDGPQLPNMSFDNWTKVKGTWYAYQSGTPAADRVWDSSNKGLSLLGINGTVPEYKHLAVEGEGKAAVKIVSRNVLWAFVAGNLFTGKFIRIVDFAGAEMEFGVPFSARPKSLSGYYHYVPKTINYAKAPYESLKGKQDVGRIEVVLSDRNAPYKIVSTEESFIDATKDPHVVGRGVLEITKATKGYVHFDIKINYKDSRTPHYIDINAASSKYGEYFTGADGSVLYLDELQFNY